MNLGCETVQKNVSWSSLIICEKANTLKIRKTKQQDFRERCHWILESIRTSLRLQYKNWGQGFSGGLVVESTLQCSRHPFRSWSGKIPWAAGEAGLVHHSCWVWEPTLCHHRGQAHTPQLEKARTEQRRPSIDKNKKILKNKIKGRSFSGHFEVTGDVSFQVSL